MNVLFVKKLSELNILKKFKDFKVKIKQFKGANESTIKYKKLFDDMINDYNSIVDSAAEIWDFNWDLLRTLGIQSKDIYKKTGKNGVDNINKEVLDNVVDSYIKLEKM